MFSDGSNPPPPTPLPASPHFSPQPIDRTPPVTSHAQHPLSPLPRIWFVPCISSSRLVSLSRGVVYPFVAALCLCLLSHPPLCLVDCCKVALYIVGMVSPHASCRRVASRHCIASLHLIVGLYLVDTMSLISPSHPHFVPPPSPNAATATFNGRSTHIQKCRHATAIPQQHRCRPIFDCCVLI